MPQTEGAARFEARVARNVLAIVGRELALAPGASLHTRNAFAVSVQPTTATWRQASAPATTTRISSGWPRCWPTACATSSSWRTRPTSASSSDLNRQWTPSLIEPLRGLRAVGGRGAGVAQRFQVCGDVVATTKGLEVYACTSQCVPASGVRGAPRRVDGEGRRRVGTDHVVQPWSRQPEPVAVAADEDHVVRDDGAPESLCTEMVTARTDESAPGWTATTARCSGTEVNASAALTTTATDTETAPRTAERRSGTAQGSEVGGGPRRQPPPAPRRGRPGRSTGCGLRRRTRQGRVRAQIRFRWPYQRANAATTAARRRSSPASRGAGSPRRDAVQRQGDQPLAVRHQRLGQRRQRPRTQAPGSQRKKGALSTANVPATSAR